MNKKAILMKRVKACIQKSVNAKEVEKMVDKMIKSGVIDLDDYNPDAGGYTLPKNMVCAISKQIFQDWAPLHLKDKKEIKNLYAVI